MDIDEIKKEFGDCDFMRAVLNTYTVDAILWMISHIEREVGQCPIKGDCVYRQEDGKCDNVKESSGNGDALCYDLESQLAEIGKNLRAYPDSDLVSLSQTMGDNYFRMVDELASQKQEIERLSILLIEERKLLTDIKDMIDRRMQKVLNEGSCDYCKKIHDLRICCPEQALKERSNP
jgi:hypothetical protein